MSNLPEIRGKVISNTHVLIRANAEGVNLNEPFFAINWFSTKVEWMYHFYNFLASRSVVKVGGKPFFKAKVTETLVDTSNSRRDLILIVRYPNGEQFKSLMQSTYFIMVSVFRIFAVSNFTFGFTHKMEADDKSQKSDSLHYALHHFKAEKNTGEILQKIKQITPASISTKYTGQMVANLYSQEKDNEPEQIPNLMDAIVVFQSPSEQELRSLLTSAAYQEILEMTPTNHVSFLNRIF